MFIYTNIGNSKFVEMHGDASDIYPPAMVFYTRHRVKITIYGTVYLHPDIMNEIEVSINRNGLLSKKITFKIPNGYDRFQ
jgi:hypothetical protein